MDLVLRCASLRVAKSLAPDGTPCEAHTKGLLQRAHVIAGDFRYVGKETDRKWEEGDDLSLLEFKTTEYGRTGKVVASVEVKNDILGIGIRNAPARANSIVGSLDDCFGASVNRNSYNEFVRWLEGYKSRIC